MAANHERPPMPKTLHFVLNTNCNAWDLPGVEGSPGVCRFCYRESNRVSTDTTMIDQLLTRLQGRVVRIVFTGGEPLLHDHVGHAVKRAKELGFIVNLHTNGLLLQERYHQLRDYVDVFSLAIDGSSAEMADWERGKGYYDRFHSNMSLLVSRQKTVAFNTFVSPHNFANLPGIAAMIYNFSTMTPVEYWLISQYRPINRDLAAKRRIYSFSPEEFKGAIQAIEASYPSISVYSQPTRTYDPYPLRLWLLANGVLTCDPGTNSGQNVTVGNCMDEDWSDLMDRVNELYP